MPRYLFYGSYTPEGCQGLMQEGGSVRIEVPKRSLANIGGSLEAFYYSNFAGLGGEEGESVLPTPEPAAAGKPNK